MGSTSNRSSGRQAQAPAPEGPAGASWGLDERAARAAGPVAQAIRVHGTDCQRAQLLPRILSGQDVYCLAFAEPAHGSDLAAIETRGEVVGGQIVVRGCKAWVAHAQRASLLLVLCRDAQDLACVALPIHDNRVELLPQRQMTGAEGLYEVVLDGARAPLDHVIGGLGGGWGVAMTALDAARRQCLDLEPEFWALVACARRAGRERDPLIRQQLAWAYTQVRVLRLLGARQPAVSASLTRMLQSEYHRRLGELAMDVLGAEGLVRPEAEGYATNRWQAVFLSSRGETIAAGTSEVLRTSLAEQVLGLPREV